jgi:ferrochelatase
MQIKREGMTHLVVIPLYPQFSISTSGSSLRLLEALFERDPALQGLKHSVIASWCVCASLPVLAQMHSSA